MEQEIISIKLKITKIGIELGDGDYSLEPYGIKGRLIHTPGHTDGSMTMLLDAGATTIYPSHGKPFSAKVFDEYCKSSV